jgi:polyferredoxin
MKKTNVIEKTFLFSWPYAFLFGLITYLITSNTDFVLSFLLGTATGLLMQSINYRIMKNLFKNNPEKIKSRQIMLYFLKYAFYALILYITSTSDAWNVYFTFVGILTFRIVSFPVVLIFANKGDDEDA